MFNNINDIEKYLLVQQLNDSSFPIGNYTQSYGLETYVQQDKINNCKNFYHYLVQNINYNFVYNELLIIKLAYNYAQKKALSQLILLDKLISATKSAVEIRQASIKLGSRLIKTISKFNLAFENSIFDQYCQQIDLGLAQSHHALIYGVLSGSFSLTYKYSILSFAYAQLSTMVNNGVKLIPLSQTVGQQLLYDLQPILIESVSKLEQLTLDDLGRSMPGFELRCIQHEKLYSRLYMS